MFVLKRVKLQVQSRFYMHRFSFWVLQRELLDVIWYLDTSGSMEHITGMLLFVQNSQGIVIESKNYIRQK